MGGLMILGGGLAGLGCALRLPRARVFEAEAHVGGRAYSHVQGGVAFDQGAHISHSRDEGFVALTGQAAGAMNVIAPSVVRNRWGGRWLTYPVQNHLHELPLDDRVRALTDLIQAHASDGAPPANYREWCRRQYGDYLTERFYDVFTAKYWRCRTEALATDWLGGRLLPSMLPRVIAGAFGAGHESQAVFSSFRYPASGGFFRLFESLYADVPVHRGERAVEIDARRKWVRFASGRVESYEALATSIPLPDLIRAIRDVPTEVRQAADVLRATKLLCVNLVVRKPALTDCHWFYSYDDDLLPARVSVPSNLAPGGTPAGCTALQGEVFRAPEEPLETGAVVEQSVEQLGRLFGFSPADVVHAGSVLVPRAYVISDPRRAAAVEGLRSWLEPLDIHTMGLYGRWKYVWSDEAFRQGRETADALAARFGSRWVA